MHVLQTRCVLILPTVLVCGVAIAKCCVRFMCLNNAVRKVFFYKMFESVRCLIKRFCMLPMDLYVARSRC